MVHLSTIIIASGNNLFYCWNTFYTLFSTIIKGWYYYLNRDILSKHFQVIFFLKYFVPIQHVLCILLQWTLMLILWCFNIIFNDIILVKYFDTMTQW